MKKWKTFVIIYLLIWFFYKGMVLFIYTPKDDGVIDLNMVQTFVADMILSFPTFKSPENYYGNCKKHKNLYNCSFIVSRIMKMDNNFLQSYFEVTPVKNKDKKILLPKYVLPFFKFSFSFSFVAIYILGVAIRLSKEKYKFREKIFNRIVFYSILTMGAFVITASYFMTEGLQKDFTETSINKILIRTNIENIEKVIISTSSELKSRKLYLFVSNKNKAVIITPYDTSENKLRIIVSHEKEDKKLKWVKEVVKDDGSIEVVKTWDEEL